MEEDFLSLHALAKPVSGLAPPFVADGMCSLSARLESLVRCRLRSVQEVDVFVRSLERFVDQSSAFAMIEHLLQRVDNDFRHLVALVVYRWAMCGPLLIAETQRNLEGVAGAENDALVLLLVRESLAAQKRLQQPPLSPPDAAGDRQPVSYSGPEASFWSLLHPHSLAAQLTAIDEAFMPRLSPGDALLAEREGFPSLSGEEYMAWLRRAPLLVASEIILCESKERIKVILYHLKVAVQLLEMRNMNSFNLVMQGLQSEAVQRLKSVWDPILQIHGRSWAKLCSAMMPRALLRLQHSPWIPPISLLQSEVSAALMDRSLTHDQWPIGGERQIDWRIEERISVAASSWWNAWRSQSFRYGIAPDEDTRVQLLRNARVLSTTELGLASRQLQSETATLADAVKMSGGLLSGFSSWLKNGSPRSDSEKSGSGSVTPQRSLPDAMFLAGADWSDVFAKAETVKMMQECVVLEANVVSSTLWRVRRGAVSVQSADGFLLGTLGEGQVFGELVMVKPLGLIVSARVLVVSPTCELQAVTFTQAAAAMRSQLQLRVRFYESLCMAISARSIDKSLDFNLSLEEEEKASREKAADKFFERFDLKREKVLLKYRAEWQDSSSLEVVVGKLYITDHYLALRAVAFGVQYRFVALLAKVTQVKQTGEREVQIMCAPLQRVTLTIEAAEDCVARLKYIVATAVVPPHQGFVPDLDNRSWEILLVAGARPIRLQATSDSLLDLSSSFVYWVVKGSISVIGGERNYEIAAKSSFGEASFFSQSATLLQVRAKSEKALLYALSWSHLQQVAASRPDVASNFLRSSAALLADRISPKPLSAVALALLPATVS